MPRPTTPKAPDAPTWTPAELMAVRHLGPGIIGKEKHAAAQAYVSQTHGGTFGPALLGSLEHSQAGPVKVVDGVPIFATS